MSRARLHCGTAAPAALPPTVRALVALILGTATANAGDPGPMTAAEFDAYTRGQTFYYGAEGSAYGAEEYLDNRRVRWSFLDGQCQDGRWYQAGEAICFVYENRPEPQCWLFFRATEGLVARFQGEGRMAELYEVEKSEDPLMCLGPEIGV